MTCVDMALAHHIVGWCACLFPPDRKFALILLADNCKIDFDAVFLMQRNISCHVYKPHHHPGEL